MTLEIFKNITTVMGCGVSCITLITLIIKPIRKKLLVFIASKISEEKRENIMAEMKKNLETLLKNDEDMIKRLGILEDQVYTNELDRLKQSIFDCGARCRRGMPLFPEEMAQVRENYKKYSEDLQGNGIGHLEFEFIMQYYNSQDFR